MKEVFNKLLCQLDRFEEVVMSAFLAAATIISFSQVVLRYGFNFSITWASELATFLLIWSALIGSAYGVRKRVHIGVDSLVNRLPDKLHRVALAASGIICICYTAMLSWLGVQFVRFLIMIGQLSPDLELPLWVAFLAVPLSSVLMLLRFVQTTWQDVANPEPIRQAKAELPPLIKKAMDEQKLNSPQQSGGSQDE